jgi:hypothetical protein
LFIGEITKGERGGKVTRVQNIILFSVMLMSIVSMFFIVGIFTKISVFEQRGFFAYGYDEKQNVWNRIRVDEKGHIYCTGEGK